LLPLLSGPHLSSWAGISTVSSDRLLDSLNEPGLYAISLDV